MKIYPHERFIRMVFPGLGARLIAIRALLFLSDSYLIKTGWLQSLKLGLPADEQGMPQPWLALSACSFLDSRLNNGLAVFEWGCGQSTLYFAHKVSKVTSIEHNNKWLELIKNTLPSNATILYANQDSNGEYCKAIHLEGAKYDLVLVDGRDRVNCMRESVNRLTDSGVILLDDSERDRYREGVELLLGQGFKVLSFDGLKPLGHNCGSTSIFYKQNNCLGI